MDGVIYKISNYSKSFLQDNGFRYSRYLSDCVDEIYTYRFPIISYKKSTVLVECEIAVSTITGIVNINVLNAGTRELYAPYYDREFGNYDILKEIDREISNKMSLLGIEHI